MTFFIVKSFLLFLTASVSAVNAYVIPPTNGANSHLLEVQEPGIRFTGGANRHHLEVQAHRGGLGMRTESSLWAFSNAMEIGVDVLEMDTVFTKDGIPVIWHDHSISDTKCRGKFVGSYIANLTLEEVKTLSCDLQLVGHPQAELHTKTRIATLEEVLDLIDCYGDKQIGINLETKLDPDNQNETLPVDKYINDIIPILQKRGFASRTTIQSFDWRTLIGIKKKFPEIVTVALLDQTTIVPVDGTYPWLGGVDLGEFDGDWVAAAASIGASILSPVHGFPSNETVNTPGYEPFLTENVVWRSHRLGMSVIPWTIDHEVTIAKLIDDGVDGIISNYPERVMCVGRERRGSSGRTGSRHRPECLTKAST
ncbi:PLC-like phosphodiesterase [Lipomyces chichibuensis]|uniref:PLC-like phosphodiesterase n=1 Tax=Lipomyces chichibuensis TaxID=1546026 RepID=UPI0033436C14